jgi:hypothetical protein
MPKALNLVPRVKIILLWKGQYYLADVTPQWLRKNSGGTAAGRKRIGKVNDDLGTGAIRRLKQEKRMQPISEELALRLLASMPKGVTVAEIRKVVGKEPRAMKGCARFTFYIPTEHLKALRDRVGMLGVGPKLRRLVAEDLAREAGK